MKVKILTQLTTVKKRTGVEKCFVLDYIFIPNIYFWNFLT